MSKNQPQEITSRLYEMVKEINDAVAAVKEAAKKNPRDIINHGKTIEKGEKRIAKEYAKRLEQLEEIQHEINFIVTFAQTMGYTLTDVEPDDQLQTEAGEKPSEEPNAGAHEPSDNKPSEEPSAGITIKVGEQSA